MTCPDCARIRAALEKVYALMDTVRHENRDHRSWVMPWNEEASAAFADVIIALAPAAAPERADQQEDSDA